MITKQEFQFSDRNKAKHKVKGLFWPATCVQYDIVITSSDLQVNLKPGL